MDDSNPLKQFAPTRDAVIALLAVFAHIGGFFSTFLIPLVIFMTTRDKAGMGFASGHARDALNFQITVLAAALLCAIVFTWLLWPLFLLDLILSATAAIKTINGASWFYPSIWRPIK